MLPTLIAISGMLAAEAPGAPAGATPAAVEIAFVTHAGEGAAGRKRFTRNGCYRAESGGSTGGAGHAHDSQAGCLLQSDVAPVFARVDAIPAAALEREQATTGAAHGAPAGRATLGGLETRVVLIRPDGTRWVAANRATTDDLLRAVDDLPSENQWDAKPPDKPAGTGAQLVVLSAADGRPGAPRFEASLASDGRWWCHRSVIGERGDEPKLPAKPAAPVMNAAVRLRRIFAGVNPKAGDEEPGKPTKKSDGVERSVEVAWPDQPRGPLHPSGAAAIVTQRFGAEMGPLSPACAIR
jgi:hypothetical protein